MNEIATRQGPVSFSLDQLDPSIREALGIKAGPMAGLDDDMGAGLALIPVSYTHLRAHETKANLVCRLLL